MPNFDMNVDRWTDERTDERKADAFMQGLIVV